MAERTRRHAPMKAVSGPLPRGPRWGYELKWDGMRAIATVGDDAVVAHSARLNDITRSFPELQAMVGRFGVAVVLDGELVAFQDGRPSFGALQQRIHLTDPVSVARAQAEMPVVYVVFDLLRVGDHDITPLPYHERRRLLDELIDDGPTWRRTDLHTGDPDALLDVVREQRLEGVVAKRLDSRYEEGRRSEAWVKVKPRQRQELVVGGWVSGEGPRSTRLSALLVGYHDETGFRFAGRVGSGLTDSEADRLLASLEPRDHSPFVDPVPPVPRRTLTWVDPQVVVEVAFGEWTHEGRLRHPVYVGHRHDVDPAQVRREQ